MWRPQGHSCFPIGKASPGGEDFCWPGLAFLLLPKKVATWHPKHQASGDCPVPGSVSTSLPPNPPQFLSGQKSPSQLSLCCPEHL